MASQTLLSLVARLQQVMSVAQGRAMLLEYARRSCGARLALLFVLDPERRALALLEHSGRRPTASAVPTEDLSSELSLEGLFASVLHQQGFLNIPDISREPLSLPAERAWAWPRGRVLLHALRQGSRQGVLVFCFSPAGARVVPSGEAQDELLICVSLLSAYLGSDENPQPVRKYTEPSEGAGRGIRSTTGTDEQASLTRKGAQPQQSSTEHPSHPPMGFAGALNLILALCELGLTTGEQMEEQALYEQILSLLGSNLRASAGCLWLYQPAQAAFSLLSSLDADAALTAYASAELNRLVNTFQSASPELSYGLVSLPAASERILIWQTLNYRERLLGALGLVLEQEPVLLLDQRLLLNVACDIIALLLLRRTQRNAERQALLEQERVRIAHDLHDSVIQDIAHVTQKLDYIQRVLEKQPQLALNEIEQSRDLLNRSLYDLRAGITALLPLPLEEQKFEEVLKGLMHEYSLNVPYLKITCDIDNPAFWPQMLQAPIYRFLQEALNNIRKHAYASEVSIHIRQVAGLGVVQISDNGQGFAPMQERMDQPGSASRTTHIGLQSMEARIRQAGGALEIHSTPGQGTILKARFPLSQSSSILTEREREVLRLLVDGLTNRAISEHLSISLETVKSHVHHIMQKMHVKDRTQAAVVATKQQWL